MNIIPTQDRREREVARLQAVRPHVPAFSAFGEDNRAAIDIQIAMLQGEVTLQQLFKRSDETSIYAGPTQYTLDQAQLVHDWLTGQLCGKECSPADGWEVFLK